MKEEKPRLTQRKKTIVISLIVLVFLILGGTGLYFFTDIFVDDSKPLKIGYSNYPYPPLHYYDDKRQLMGFDIDLARAAAEIMGAEIEFVPINWYENEDMLISKEVDMLWGGLETNSLDSAKIKFTSPYLSSDIILLMKEDRNYKKPEDLQGLNVCALNYTPAYFYLRDNRAELIKSARSSTPPEYENLSLFMSTGESDCMITDTSFASFFKKQNNDISYKTSAPVKESDYAVAVRAKDRKLLTRLQSALSALEADGTVDRLKAKWIGD